MLELITKMWLNLNDYDHVSLVDFGPLRRNTTDLSEFLEAEKSSGPSETKAHLLNPNDSSVTIRLRKSNSFNESDNAEKSSSSDSPSPPPRSKTPTPVPTFQVSDSTKELTNGGSSVKKTSSSKATGSSDTSSSDEAPATKTKKTKRKRLLIQGVQEVVSQASQDDLCDSFDNGGENMDSSADVAFIIQVRQTHMFCMLI